MSLKTLIKENKIEASIDSISKLIEKHLTINLDNISDDYKFIGQGAYANVYSIKEHPEKVIRIQHDWSPVWEELINKNFDNVVKVYYEKDIDINYPERFGCHLIVMEKLEPLDEDEWNTILYISDNYGDSMFFYEVYEMGSIYKVVEEEDVPIAESVDYIINDVIAGMDQLESVGIRHRDIYQDNIMYDPTTRKYKLIDIG